MPLYSHSGLSSFENCPRQFWYRYIGKPEILKVDTVEAFLGKRAHESLEELYRLRLGGRVLSESETLDLFDSAWEKSWSNSIRVISPTLTAEDYRRTGREALAAYHRRHQPFDVPRTLRIESRVLIDLDETGGYRMQGYIDRIARRNDGAYEIHDYKTAGHLPTQAQADADRQLALYTIGLRGLWNDVERVDLIWHYLRFDTQIVSHRTDEQLDEIRSACIAAITDIESRGRDEPAFPTNRTRLCDWCEFSAICPATRHEIAIGALDPAQFKLDDGVALVDAWAATRDRRRELEAEVCALKQEESELQARIEAFAAQNGIEAVTGSTCRAEVKRIIELSYPLIGSDIREAFEAALKETGIWDRVALPNHGRMTSLLAALDTLPPEVVTKISPFIERTDRLRASLRKKNTAG